MDSIIQTAFDNLIAYLVRAGIIDRNFYGHFEVVVNNGIVVLVRKSMTTKDKDVSSVFSKALSGEYTGTVEAKILSGSISHFTFREDILNGRIKS